MHGCLLSTVATDALVLKHQTISIHSADKTFIVLDKFYIILHSEQHQENNTTFWKQWYDPDVNGLSINPILFCSLYHIKLQNMRSI